MQKLQPQDHTGQVEAEGGTERIQALHWEVPESPGQSQAWMRLDKLMWTELEEPKVLQCR